VFGDLLGVSPARYQDELLAKGVTGEEPMFAVGSL
jgi:hypothetical protein